MGELLFNAAFMLLEFKTNHPCKNNEPLVNLSPALSTLPQILEYENIIKSMNLNELIFFAENYCLCYPKPPIPFKQPIGMVIKNLSSHARDFYTHTANGFKKLLKSGEIKRVSYFKPSISFSERFQGFSIVFYYEIEYFTGNHYFYSVYTLPDDELETAGDLNKYIDKIFSQPHLDIIADNPTYAFHNGNRRYSSGYTSYFLETDFIKYNFGIDFDDNECKVVVVAPGKPSFYSTHSKRGHFSNINIYALLNDKSVLCTVENADCKKAFDYSSYRAIAFEQMAIFSVVSDLLSLYCGLLCKETLSSIETVHLSSLQKSLVNIKKIYSLKYDKAIEDSLESVISGTHEGYARILGKFAGAAISEFFSE